MPRTEPTGNETELHERRRRPEEPVTGKTGKLPRLSATLQAELDRCRTPLSDPSAGLLDGAISGHGLERRSPRDQDQADHPA
jgi:hypothetical protein